MGSFFLACSIILAVVTAIESIRTMIETRRRYYKEFLRRKGRA
jgi:hypothetical protein